MNILWAPEARDDLDRLADFVAAYDPELASRIEHELSQAPKRLLLDFPRLGERVSDFDPREVREFRVGRYLLRYEIKASEMIMLRIFHSREDRWGS